MIDGLQPALYLYRDLEGLSAWCFNSSSNPLSLTRIL